MPEIKVKHIASFSSEDKVHRAENLLKPETYRKWKCAAPGEKKATVVLQFEKATQIYSIDIGNECSAFVEVLVGRSSDSVNDFQVLLVASSFMSPLESKNESHTNRVRMFGPEKLAQNLKDEKWDTVQIVCTQPFNKNITHGLTFVKFHSPPDKVEESQKDSANAAMKFGAFNLKSEEEEPELSVGSWFNKRSQIASKESLTSPSAIRKASDYAAAVLASNSSIPKPSTSQANTLKRKFDADSSVNKPPPEKKEASIHVNKEKIGHKDIFGERKNEQPKTTKKQESPLPKSENRLKQKPFNQLMDKVVFSLSGFVNPLRSEIRDKALEMGAKYKGDWDSTCTHLVCAFLNTPKYIQVQGQGGRIVSKDWIKDCHRKKKLFPWKRYKLGKTSQDSSSDESEEEVTIVQQPKKPPPTINGASKDKTPVLNKIETKVEKRVENVKDESSKNSKRGTDYNSGQLSKIFDSSDSKTEDEDAIQDYLADTDRESSSGSDTEGEIRKVQRREELKAKNTTFEKKSDLSSKPNTQNLPLPELPNFFKGKHFFLYGDFSSKLQHDLERYITAYNGIIENFMSDTIKYVVTELKWDKSFDEALAENEDLIFVKSQWIKKCHEAGKLVPYQPFIIIPNT